MNRVINTAAELDALPVGSVVRSDEYEYGEPIYARQADAWFCAWGWEGPALPRLPATVLHDPSVPVVPVLSDAAVEAGARALYRTEYDDRDLTDAPANLQSAYRADARAVLSAALPHLAAVPSATREELSALLLTFLRPPKHGGSWTYSPDEAADALLARFTIVPR